MSDIDHIDTLPLTSNINDFKGKINNFTSKSYKNVNNVQLETIDFSVPQNKIAKDKTNEVFKDSGTTISSGVKSKVDTEGSWWDDIKNAYLSLNDSKAQVKTNILGLFTGESNIKDVVNSTTDYFKQYFATKAVVSSSVISGVGKVGEWLIVDGLSMAVTGVASALTGTYDLVTQNGWQSTNAMWQNEMDFVSEDLVGNAKKYIFEETDVGKYINENSTLKYDSKGAEAIQNVAVKGTEIAIVTGATVVTGGAATPLIVAGLGFIEGTGKKGEELFSQGKRDGKDIASAYLNGVATGADWYAYSSVSSGIYKAINKIPPDTMSMSVKTAKKLTDDGFIKSALKKTFSNVDVYLDTAATLSSNEIRVLQGEHVTWKDLALGLGLSIGGNMIGDAISVGKDLKSAKSVININKNDIFFSQYNWQSTLYGVDQNATRKFKNYRVMDSNWLKNPNDFYDFLIDKGYSVEKAVDIHKALTTKGNLININGRELIKEYIGTISDYNLFMDTLDSFSKCYLPEVNDEYIRLQNKLVSQGMNIQEATRTLDAIDTTGVCSYASVANAIMASFKDNPDEFSRVFGYDMFTTINGKKTLNTSELILDMYTEINSKWSNDGVHYLFTKNNNVFSINNLDTENQIYLSTFKQGHEVRVIADFLKSKDTKLSYTSLDKSFGGVIGNKPLEIDKFRTEIIQNLQSNNQVELGIYATTNNEFKLRNMDGTINTTTNSWNEGGGHAIFVTGANEKGVIVSSWGEKLLIDWDDFVNNKYSILCSKIGGINGIN